MIELGDSGNDVLEVREMLRAAGFVLKEHISVFNMPMDDAVRLFQAQHVGSNGKFLDTDGKVGPQTLWALSHLDAEPPGPVRGQIPSGLTPLRQKVLEAALGQYALGVAEVPRGSNRGPVVDKYLPKWRVRRDERPGPPWCAFFATWCLEKAIGEKPFGANHGSCRRLHREANIRGMLQAEPTPGDLFVMLYRDKHGRVTSKGHTGFVLRVSGDGAEFNTIEGNCGHRLRLGTRQVDPTRKHDMHFLRPSQTESQIPMAWERGIIGTKALSGQTR